jgi:Helix-destabilising protein
MTTHIYVKRAEAREQTSQKTGKKYYTQDAWLQTFDREGRLNDFPEKITVYIDGPDKAYQVGTYTLDPKSFRVGDYGRIEVSPILTAVDKASK